jgi:hypothetical protein
MTNPDPGSFNGGWQPSPYVFWQPGDENFPSAGKRPSSAERGKARWCGLDSNPYVLYLFSSVKIDEARPIMQIHYTALPFVRLENGGLVPGEAVECPHSTAVIRRADRMVRNEANAGAVALARIESPRLGEFEEPVILKTFGDVPDDFDCARVSCAQTVWP